MHSPTAALDQDKSGGAAEGLRPAANGMSTDISFKKDHHLHM